MKTYYVFVLCCLGLALDRIGCIPALERERPGNFTEASNEVDQEFVSKNAWTTEGFEEQINSERKEQSVKPDGDEEFVKKPYITISPSGPTLNGTPVALAKLSFYCNYMTLSVGPRKYPTWSVLGGSPHVRLERMFSWSFEQVQYGRSTQISVKEESFPVQQSIQFYLHCQLNSLHKFLKITVDPIPAFYPCNLTVNCSESYDQNSFCFTSAEDSSCTCKEGFRLEKYGCQRIVPVTDYPCTSTLNCTQNYDKNSRCISKRCFCNYGYRLGERGCEFLTEDTEIGVWNASSHQQSTMVVFFCAVCVIIGIFSVLLARRTRMCKQCILYSTPVSTPGSSGHYYDRGGGAFPVSDSGGNGEWNRGCIDTSLISDPLVREIWEDKPPAYEEVPKENFAEPGSPPPAYSTHGTDSSSDRSGNINEHACIARLAQEARQEHRSNLS